MLEHTISKKAVSTIVEVSGMCTPQADSAGLPRGWIEIELAEREALRLPEPQQTLSASPQSDRLLASYRKSRFHGTLSVMTPKRVYCIKVCASQVRRGRSRRIGLIPLWGEVALQANESVATRSRS